MIQLPTGKNACLLNLSDKLTWISETRYLIKENSKVVFSQSSFSSWMWIKRNESKVGSQIVFVVWRAVANVNVSHFAESEKWNVTTLIWRGIFLSLQRFIAPALDLIPLLQAVGERDSKKGAVNCCNLFPNKNSGNLTQKQLKKEFKTFSRFT